MPLKQNLVRDLERIKLIVTALDNLQFVAPLKVLSGNSIGKHVRHIIEFYLVLTKIDLSDLVTYDDRKRNRTIETDRAECLVVIDSIVLGLNSLDETRELIVSANYDEMKGEAIHHRSSLSRELGYVLEHSIHHQAIIKIGLTALGRNLVMNLGVAPATLRHQNNSSAN